MGQINLIQFDIKTYNGYCEPNYLTQLGNKKNIIQVVGQINFTHFIYITLLNKNQLVPYDDSVYILFLHIQGPLLVTSPKLNTYHTV